MAINPQLIVPAFMMLCTLFLLWKKGLNISSGMFVIMVSLFSALNILDLMSLDGSPVFSDIRGVALVVEGLLCPVLLFFSMVFCRSFSWKGLSRANVLLLVLSFLPVCFTLFIPASGFFYSPDFNLDKVLFLEPVAFFYYLQVLLFMAVALYNLEATVAHARHGVKWKIKFAIIGAGAMIVSFMLYFSQSLLLRAIDVEYVYPRMWAGLLGLLMVMYSELKRGREKIVISRQLAYKSFVVLFSAAFFLIVGIAGEGAKLFGSQFSSFLFLLVLFAAVMGLLVLLLSETWRRKVKVLIQREFYGEKYDYRAEWLKFTRQVTGARSMDQLCSNILIFFCETFGTGGGVIFLQGRNSENFSPALFHEMEADKQELSPTSQLIQILKKENSILDLSRDQGKIDVRLQEYCESRGIRFIIPIFTESSLLGVIMLGSPVSPMEKYDSEDEELMRTVARQVATSITNVRLGDELAEARDMEGFGKVATFLLHDLKNQVYPLKLLVDNAREFIDDPEFQQDMIESLTNIVDRMNALIAQLVNIPRRETLNLDWVDLMELARETGELVADAEIKYEGKSVKAYVDKKQMQKVLLNLYLNAIEAGDSREILVKVDYEDGPVIKVIDFGDGIDEQILREGLFVPFKTTKERGMGIGLYQSKQIMEAHGGGLLASSRDEGGAVFSIVLSSENIEFPT